MYVHGQIIRYGNDCSPNTEIMEIQSQTEHE
jgi:hypothetical protein